MPVISVDNMKGGCGKTVTSINLCGYLSHKKKKVLLIDGDYQANSTFFLGKKRDAVLNRRSLYEALIGKYDIKEMIVGTDFPNFDLIPATGDLAQFNEKSQDRYRLRGLIREAKLDKEYDYIVIDSRPELSDLFRNIIVASDHLVLPIFPDSDSIDGLSLLLKNVKELSDSKRTICGESINLLGAVITNIDKRFAAHTNLLPIIRSALEDKGIKILSEIPRSGAVPSSQDLGRPIAYCPRFRSIPVGKALEAIALSVMKISPRGKGRPFDIPTFTDKEKEKYTAQLYKAEGIPGLQGEAVI